MGSPLIHKRLGQYFTVTLLFVAGACSGPQMISPPEEAPQEAAIVKKPAPIIKDEKAVPVESDDRGVFDDEDHRLKADLIQWKLIADEDGIQSYEKIKSNSGLVAFRGEILIPAPLKKVATILSTEALEKEWVDSYVESKIISQKNEYEHIEYDQTKVPWPFQNRDFVFNVIGKVNVSPPTMLILMKSVVDPAAPPISGIVRGEIVHSYYYLKEMLGTHATKMVVEMEVDPKGAIPMWLVNLSQKGWPHNTLAAIKKLCLRKDIPVLAKFDQYFEEKTPVIKKSTVKTKKGGK